MGVTLGPSTLTYGANQYYLLSTKRIVKSKSVTIQEFIPSDFPWQVKSGRHQFTVLKRTKKRNSNRKTATNNDTSKSVSTQRSNVERVNPDTTPQINLTSGREGDNSAPPPEPPLSRLDGNKKHTSEQRTQVAVPSATERPEVRISSVEASNAALQQYLQKTRKAPKAQGNGMQVEEVQMLMTALLDARENQRPSDYPTGIAEARNQTLENGYDPPPLKRTSIRQAEKAQQKPRLTPQPTRKNKRKKLRATQVESDPLPPPSPDRASEPEQTGLRKSERQALRKMRKHTAQAARRIYKAYRISVKQGLEGEYAQESREAIISEIQNMLQYRVGHYIRRADIPKDKLGNILQSFMFLKHKTLPDGTYDKTKARMVGNGATQKTHMYDMVSSSTVALASVFMLCNLASHMGANISTYDIKGAFLHAEFSDEDEVTYIRVNKEVTALWIEQDPSAAPFVDGQGTLLLELDKFIYGLKQSPLKFQQHLRLVLTNLGYTQTGQDECIYVKREGTERFSILSTHVDDIMQVASHAEFYAELKEGLVKAY
eukprot:gene21029-23870_t